MTENISILIIFSFLAIVILLLLLLLFLLLLFSITRHLCGLGEHIIITLDVAAVVHAVSRFLHDGIANPTGFEWLGCLPRLGKPSVSCYLTHNWRRKRRIRTFPKGICAKRITTNSVGIWSWHRDSISRANNHYSHIHTIFYLLQIIVINIKMYLQMR